MKAIVRGVRPVNFESNGNKIEGNSVYVSFETEGVIGEATERYFVKSSVASAKDLPIGKTVEIYFTSRGKVDMIYAV